ncbi:MAG TPA: universal stress protein [Candidatus Methanoperedens sp.]|nr:universal stress protein [Candidatus Methanoperedens sp.]
MKKILVAVDETKGSTAVLAFFRNLVRPPEEVILLYVQRLEGKSLMIDMLGEAELATLREALEGTEHREALDRKAERILAHYKREFETRGLFRIKTICREGVPAEQILKVAAEEGADLILAGSNGKQGLDRLITGSVSRDLQLNATVPVVVANATAVKDEAQVAGHLGSLVLKEQC